VRGNALDAALVPGKVFGRSRLRGGLESLFVDVEGRVQAVRVVVEGLLDDLLCSTATIFSNDPHLSPRAHRNSIHACRF
jgi:hypothetical protein